MGRPDQVMRLASQGEREHCAEPMTITPPELKKRLEQRKDFRLIDVREPDEWAVARLPEAELMPLSQFEQLAAQELATDEKIILYCHHGMRSGRAQAFLKAQGYTDVLNLTGGIEAWSTQVDPSVPRY
jgi:rhodanese-related sulfurtransferase